LAGTGAGGDDEVLPFGSELGGHLLMIPKGPAPEDLRATRINTTACDQFGHRCPGFVFWVDLKDRLWPEALGIVLSVDLRFDVFSTDIRERAAEALVLVHQ